MHVTRRALAAAGALALAAAPAAAQYDPPGVFISPEGGTVHDSLVSVTITWSHEYDLNQLSHTIKLNGVQVGGYAGGSQMPGFPYVVRLQSDGGGTLMARSTGQVRLASGSNTLEAHICSAGACTTETSLITYVPPPPPAQRAPLQISLAPHHSGYQDPTRFGSTLSYTTPSYVSLGQERSLTLLYVSETAFPRNFVQIDVTDPSLDPPDVISIKVADSTGVTTRQVTNGGHIAYWRNTGGTTGMSSRVAAQWSMLSIPTSAPKSTLILQSWWEEADGSKTMLESRDTIRVPMVNRAGSPYGAGWMVAGVQRLHVFPNGVLVDEGTGAASWFRKSSTTIFDAPAGDRSHLTYDPNTSSYKRRWPDGLEILYNSLGQPVYKYNLLGDTTRYTFSGDRLTYLTDPAGKSFQLLYDASNKLQRIVDPQGRTAWITVTAGQLTQVVDFDGVTALGNVTYELNASGSTTRRVSGWTDRGGGQWNVQYDLFGTPTAVTAPQVTLATGALARPRTTATSEKTRLLTGGGVYPGVNGARRLPADSAYFARADARGYVTRTWAERFGQPVKVVGPLGHATIIERDTLGQPVSITGPNGSTVHVQWNADGQVAQSFDESRGVQSDYTYQTQGGGTFVSRSSEGVDDVHYDRGSKGEVLAVRRGTDPNPVVRYRYDARMRVDTIIDAGNHVTAFFYDGNTSFNVDSVRMVTADGTQRTAYTYDAYGRRTSVRSPENVVTSITYDAINRALKERVPGDSVQYAYFGGDSVVVTDAAGKRYTSVVNRLGWMVAERDASGRTTTIGYDSTGNAVATTDRAGRQFTSQFDALGRMTSLASPDGTTTWGFDNPGGAWMWVSNAESTDTLHLDDAGRPVRVVSQMGGQRYSMDTRYDLAGRIVGLGTAVGPQFTPSWTSDMEYAYDARGRLTGLRELAGAWTSVTYNAEDLPSQVTYPGGLGTLTFGYTTRHRLKTAGYSLSGLNTSFGEGLASYDVTDRLVSRSNTAGTRQRLYGYDGQGRVSSFTEQKWVTYPPPPFCEGPATSEECLPYSDWAEMRAGGWGYDAVGNRTSATYSDSAGTVLSWTPALQAFSNRYSRYGASTDTLAYDSVGNLVRRRSGAQAYDYQWNSLGQLVSVTGPAGTVYYGYNGLGMRVRRTSGGVTTRFLYDANDNLAAEVDASGNRIRQYAYWPGVDQPFSMRTWESGQNGATYYYALDLPTSNVRGLFSASGTVTHRYDYDPFGRQLTASGTLANPLRFAGRELDAAAGLYYVRARWYDPVLGRFISEDPIGLNGGINGYAYALNDPVNLNDPSGLAPWSCDYDGVSACSNTYTMDGITVVSGRGPNTGFSAFLFRSRGMSIGAVFGGWNDDGSGPGVWESVKSWNECVSSTTNENFQTTHQAMANLPSQAAKQVASLGLGTWAAKKLGDSGLIGDAWRWARAAPQRGLLNAGTRVWVSQIGGRTIYGMGPALFRAAQKGVVTTLAFETGVGLGSVFVGLAECSF